MNSVLEVFHPIMRDASYNFVDALSISFLFRDYHSTQGPSFF